MIKYTEQKSAAKHGSLQTIYLGLGWTFVMLYKTNFWMRTIGSVLLDFILVTLSQNWGTHFELVAKRRKDSNSLLISLWFLDLLINLF